jgi:DNA-binding response OmpR family regulator
MSKRLLILMDDEPVTCRTLALDLTDAGYDVETAADTDEAIRKLAHSPFDLLITGEGSRGSDGKLLERLRKTRPAAKVVVMTTRGGTRVESSARGARVRKPFDLEEFRSVVEQLLHREGREEGSAK